MAELPIPRTCPGKKNTVKGWRDETQEKIDSLLEAINDAHEEALPGLEAKLDEYKGILDGLADKHDDLELGRKSCGRDLNPIILSTPEDGELYTHTCPDCGNEFKVRRIPLAAE